MKSYLLALFLLASIYSFGQAGPDSAFQEQYCLVEVYAYTFSKKVEVSADYGVNNKIRSGKLNIVRDEEGKRKSFLSEADALNFFGARGWKLVNAFPVISGRSSYTHYIFKKTDRIIRSEE